MISFALALLAQIGPFPTAGIGTQPVSPLPPEVIEQKERRRQQRQQQAEPVPQPAPRPDAAPSPVESCLALANDDAEQAIDYADAWLQKAKGAPAAPAHYCRGVALGRLARWDEAAAAFLAARDAIGAADKPARARFGAMAGIAALSRGDGAAALTALDVAHADALAAPDKALAGDIAIDRARALVVLKRDADAATALAEARESRPQDAEGWLLSATLSRRMNRLADAQAQIEKAAALLPVDPDIGLEAGVIAMLAGREDAARKSWQSVIAAAPQSDAATTARGYLAQTGAPAPATGAAKP